MLEFFGVTFITPAGNSNMWRTQNTFLDIQDHK